MRNFKMNLVATAKYNGHWNVLSSVSFVKAMPEDKSNCT